MTGSFSIGDGDEWDLSFEALDVAIPAPAVTVSMHGDFRDDYALLKLAAGLCAMVLCCRVDRSVCISRTVPSYAIRRTPTTCKGRPTAFAKVLLGRQGTQRSQQPPQGRVIHWLVAVLMWMMILRLQELAPAQAEG